MSNHHWILMDARDPIHLVRSAGRLTAESITYRVLVFGKIACLVCTSPQATPCAPFQETPLSEVLRADHM